MYIGQDAELAEAYVPWIVSMWQAYRGETPPMDMVYTLAQSLASGAMTTDQIIAKLTP
jgi:hypothetical protein